MTTVNLDWKSIWEEVESKADYAADPDSAEGWIFRLYAAEKRIIQRAVEKQIEDAPTIRWIRAGEQG